MKIHLEYYAVLRECAGKSSEAVETSSTTARDLYLELQSRYTFPLDAGRISVAINETHASMSATLHENDTLVFIAPVSGG